MSPARKMHDPSLLRACVLSILLEDAMSQLELIHISLCCDTGSWRMSKARAIPASGSPSYHPSEDGSGASTPERGRSRRAAAKRGDAFRQHALHSPDHGAHGMRQQMSPGHAAPVTTAATAAALAALTSNGASQLPFSSAGIDSAALANAAGIAAALMGAFSPQGWGRQESRSRRPTRPRSVSARETSEERGCALLVPHAIYVHSLQMENKSFASGLGLVVGRRTLAILLTFACCSALEPALHSVHCWTRDCQLLMPGTCAGLRAHSHHALSTPLKSQLAASAATTSSPARIKISCWLQWL